MYVTDFSRRGFLGAIAAVPACAAASRVNEPAQYPLFRAKGTHRELGRQHGEQAAEYIKRHLDVMCSGQKLSRTGQVLADFGNGFHSGGDGKPYMASLSSRKRLARSIKLAG